MTFMPFYLGVFTEGAFLGLLIVCFVYGWRKVAHHDEASVRLGIRIGLPAAALSMVGWAVLLLKPFKDPYQGALASLVIGSLAAAWAAWLGLASVLFAIRGFRQGVATAWTALVLGGVGLAPALVALAREAGSGQAYLGVVVALVLGVVAAAILQRRRKVVSSA